MTDAHDDDNSTLKASAPLKLQLNRQVDPNRLKAGGGMTLGKSSKTVTVEVRKNRAPGAPVKTETTTIEAKPLLGGKPTLSLSGAAPVRPRAPEGEAPAGQPAQPLRRLTDEEKSSRLRAVQGAQEQARIDAEKRAREAERRREQERLREEERQREEERRWAEQKAREAEREARAEKSRKGGPKKTHRDEVDLTHMFHAAHEDDDDTGITVLASSTDERPVEAVAEDDPALAVVRGADVAEEEEYEDYSEDVEEDDGSDILTLRTPGSEERRTDLVRPVKGADKVIIAPVSREKLKKQLRSEAAVVTTSRPAKPRVEERKDSVRTVLNQFAEQAPSDGRSRSMASLRRHRDKGRRHVVSREAEKVYREVTVPEAITVQELANRMSEKAGDVVKSLIKMGMMVTVNQVIDADTAELVVTEFGHKVKRVSESDVENVLIEHDEDEAMQSRPPVVTVMGHVDHGKTTLLDALRSTDVAAGEAGGITQHIGAYQVKLPSGARITFIDTPGHEAFTAMRSRGAKVTDLVVLVVSADDGIKEQTVEAINHAKAAQVPIIVAVNKIDKPEADPARVRNELLQHELVPEEFGGDIICVDISAKQRLNLDKLEEAILLQAEVLDLKANPDRRAAGTVLESKIDKGRGVVASLLVQKGTLRVGDIVVAGGAYGRVRSLVNDKGQNMDKVEPSGVVEMLGLAEVPGAGDEFAVVENEKTARDVAEYRQQRAREKTISAGSKNAMEQFLSVTEGQTLAKELPVLVKGDVQGSVEAIVASLAKVQNDEARIRVLHSGVGAITESDIGLASASRGLIYGFNVRANPQAKEIAGREGVEIRYYSIIYDLVDDAKAALSGILTPKKRDKFIGYAEIRQVFTITGHGKIAGCMVTQGLIKRGAKVRLLRDNVVIHEGWLKTLRRFKDDVKEVKEGFECGVAFENYEDIREGDLVEAFEVEEIAVTIE